MRYIIRPVITILLLCCHVIGANGQTMVYDPSVFIDVNINSGNPTTPYPQFLEYKAGKSLAKYNSEGVTHADMELAGREAYEIMTHRCRYFGTHCGVKYIVFNPIANGGTTETSYTYPDVPGAYGTFCSEGDGYMLLASAIFADQKTFNGLYMWIHDNRFSKIKRFQDGRMLRPEADCGPYLAGWSCDETTAYGSPCHSATDGDVDIAMAMLVAYKQWGEWMMQDGEQVKDSEGNPISLRDEAMKVIGALVDTFPQGDAGNGKFAGYISGDVGIDGFIKNGNTWGEFTQWRTQQNDYPWGVNKPNLGGNYGTIYPDYNAPSYFNEFWKLMLSELKDEKTDWRVTQFKRAEASADWLTGQAYAQGLYPSIGTANTSAVDASSITFGNALDGEGFRFAWRNLLNYLWHGAPEFVWNPKTHQIEEGTNTINLDMSKRHAELLKNPIDASGNVFCTKLGASPDAGQPSWCGVSQIPQQFNTNGTPYSAYHTNYELGASAGAVVLSEDLDLLGDFYRQCDLTWDGNNTDVTAESEERYIGSTPKYFHGWYRCLGLLTCTGNLLAPETMTPKANMKVYMSVDKTYAYVDDNVDYTVQYRNYGTKDAEGVTITTVIDADDYDFVSATKGGTYDPSTHTITWKIGTVPGFKTGGLDATIDSVAFRVVIKDTINPRVCLTSTIKGDNFDEWVSNEYPNHATYTMERNCVDILANRTLKLKKTANRTALNPNDVVKFTLEFSNLSEGENSWMNGGRDHVRLSYGNNPQSYVFYQYYRFWNDAKEAYINLGNYRVSYFMYDAAAIGLYDAAENPTGWTFELDNGNDMAKYGWMPTGSQTTFTYQKIPQGEDEHGKWNQRLMIQFPGALMAPSTAVYDHLNNAFQLHKGGYGPCFFRTALKTNPAQEIPGRMTDDWSYSKDVSITAIDGQADTYTLISPGWANYDDPGYEITNYSRHTCSPKSVDNFERVLVEEFDGYTWRRIQGTGPLPGREAYDVVVVDTIPYELEWVQWIDSTALKNDAGEKIQAKYTPAANPKSDGYTGIVKWTVPVMLVGEADKLVYACKARDLGCPEADDAYYKNVAWIMSKTDSPDSSQVEMMTTCAELPPVVEPQSVFFKSADKEFISEGDPISYNLKFVNTEGSLVQGDFTKYEDWVALGGFSMPSVGNSGLILSKDAGCAAAPTFSYGKDVSAKFTIKGASNSSNLWVVLRYVSGTPGSPNFKGVAVQLNINNDGNNFLGYSVYTDGKMIDSKTGWAEALQFPGSNTEVAFQLTLKGDHLYLYCNDEDDEWTNVLKDWSGITSAGPGYVGVYSGRNNNDPQLTDFVVTTDYVYQVTFFDAVPEGLTDVDNISDGGTYDESSRYIDWPYFFNDVKDPLLPGDSIVVTFDAVVDKCEKYITNQGFSHALGTSVYTAIHTATCGSQCLLEDVSLTLDNMNICEGDSTVLTAVPNEDGSYYYTCLKDGETYVKNSSKNKFTLTEAGTYQVVVTSRVDPSCTAKSGELDLTVNEKPVGEDYAIGVICVGSKAADNEDYASASAAITAFVSAGDEVEWFDADGEALSDMPNPDVEKVGEYDYSYCIVSKNGCVSDTFHFTFSVADTSVVKLSDLTICAGQSATLTVEENAGDSYLWSDGSDKNELVTDKEGLYSVVVTTNQGCVSRGSAKVIVAEQLEVNLGNDTIVCESSLPFVLDASSSYDTYEWTDGSNKSTFEVSESGEYEVKVAQGTCYGSGSIKVTVSPSPKLSGSFKVMYLLNDTTSNGVFDKSLSEYDESVITKESGITYVWFDANERQLDEEPTPSVPASGNSETFIYYVKAVNADGCESELQKVTVQVSGSPMPVAEDVSYCLNDSDVKPLTAMPSDDGSNTLWKLNWYDADDNKLDEAPIPSTAVAGVTNYFVAQEDQLGVEGGKSLVSVTVYDLPVIKAEPETVNLCDAVFTFDGAFKEVNGLTVSYSYFDADQFPIAMADCGADCVAKVSKSGTYYAEAYYAPVSGLVCTSSELVPVEVVIDRITDLNVDASPSVCPFGDIDLSASAKSELSPIEFIWSGDASSFDADLKTKDESGEVGKTYTFNLLVSAGVCEKDTTVYVNVGRGVLSGSLSANGVETKVYRTCGDEDIELSATHEGTDFKWTNYGGDLIAEEVTAVVRPTQTTTYILSFVNQCETSDTLVVEVYPFSLSTDFTLLDTSVCEGSSASGKLILNGYDEKMEGSYIKWFKDNIELADYAGLSQINLSSVSSNEAGLYTFEVSNGICMAKILDGDESANLVVNPFVSYTLPENVTAANGGSVSIELGNLAPADASVSWKGSVNGGEGNPLVIDQVFKDELFDVSVSADGYCERDTQLQLLVDAKVVVSLSVSATKICLDDILTLTADTAGTGTLLHPDDYTISWYSCGQAEDCSSMGQTGASISYQPAATYSYYAVVNYGNQSVNSDTITVSVVEPFTYVTSTDVVVCSGEETTLSVVVESDSSAVVTWADENSSVADSIKVSPLNSTKYGFTITTEDGLCPLTDSIPVVAKQKPAIKMEGDTTICAGSTITFDPLVTGDEIDSYLWTNEFGDTIAETQRIAFDTTPAEGRYDLTVTSASCGSITESRTVFVSFTPGLLIDSLSINSRKIIPLMDDPGYLEYKLDNGEWSTKDVYENIVFDYPHTIFVRNELGCEGMLVFTVPAPPIVIPDYFTPTGDGDNDSWDVSPIMDAYPKSTVKIFDRTGKVVAILDGDQTDWDGTYNGNPLPSTDYWYLINVPEIHKQFTGHFTLIRSK